MVAEDEKDKEMKNSGAQGAILRKTKKKRRSTGVVQFNADVSELFQFICLFVYFLTTIITYSACSDLQTLLLDLLRSSFFLLPFDSTQ